MLVPLHLPLWVFASFFLFFSFFFLSCIVNLYCMLKEEYPIKLWKKKTFPHSKQLTVHLLLTSLVNFESWGGVKWAGNDIFNTSSPFTDDWFSVFRSLLLLHKVSYAPPMFLLAHFWTIPAGVVLWTTKVSTGNTFYSSTLYTCSGLFLHIQGCFLSSQCNSSLFPWKYAQFWACDLRQL